MAGLGLTPHRPGAPPPGSLRAAVQFVAAGDAAGFLGRVAVRVRFRVRVRVRVRVRARVRARGRVRVRVRVGDSTAVPLGRVAVRVEVRVQIVRIEARPGVSG